MNAQPVLGTKIREERAIWLFLQIKLNERSRREFSTDIIDRRIFKIKKVRSPPVLSSYLKQVWEYWYTGLFKQG